MVIVQKLSLLHGSKKITYIKKIIYLEFLLILESYIIYFITGYGNVPK